MHLECVDGRWRLIADDGAVLSDDFDVSPITAGGAPAALVGEPTATAAQPEGDTVVAAAPAPVLNESLLRPPAAWFADPGFTDDTTVPSPECADVRGCPLTIGDDGRVYGHAALWASCHIGFEGECVAPPHSVTDYAYYRTGQTATAEGELVATGTLTVGTGHASTDPARPISWQVAAAHYDDSGVAVADVAAGEDRYGIWVAGAIRPEATAGQVEALRRSSLSGDWRRIKGNLEMVAALGVNVPGFPVPRYGLAAAAQLADPVAPQQADDDGGTYALVAAGAQTLSVLAAQPWSTEIGSLRTQLEAMQRELGMYAEVLRPMVASAYRERLAAFRAAPEPSVRFRR